MADPLIDPDLDFHPCERPGTLTREHYQRDWEQVRHAAEAAGLLPEQPMKWPITDAVAAYTPDAERQLVAWLGTVLSAVETVAARWRRDAGLREFLNLPAAIEERALREPVGPRAVDYCRFDLTGLTLADTRIFEIGGDFPGGLPTSGVLNRYWRDTDGVGPLVRGYRAARIEQPGWQVGALLDLATERGLGKVGLGEVDRVALLVAAELHPLPELDLVRDQIAHHGRTSVLHTADDAAADDIELALLMYPNTPFVGETQRYAHLLDRIADGRLITFNGILGRFIGANKLTLAVLSDPRFRSLFDPEQRAAIEAVVPWSRKVGDGVSAREACSMRAEVVLKAPFDAISAGVHLGQECDETEWTKLVDRAAEEGWLVQEFVPEQTLETDAGLFHRTLGTAFLGGRPVGHTARLSSSLRATLTPGGGIQPVFGNYVG